MDMIASIEGLQFEVKDILKRLYMLENIMLSMTNVIDIANNYEKRLKRVEHQLKGRKSKMENNEAQQLQNNAVKKALVEKGYSYYRNLIAYMKQLPVNQEAMTFAYMNLDQGMHWFEKIVCDTKFNFAKVNEQTPAPPPASPTAPEQQAAQQEVAKEVCEETSEPQTESA